MKTDAVCGCRATCRVAYGCCHCGCGGSTRIAPQTSTERGWIKGSPIRYIRGHSSGERKDRHVLTEVDVRNRRAQCSRCGEVSIKKDAGRSSGWQCTKRIITEHRISDVNTVTMTGWCRGCQAEVKLVRGTSRLVCSIRKSRDEAEYRINNSTALAQYSRDWRKINGRAYHLRKTYGLTLEQYAEMLAAQGGVCASCGGPPRGPGAANNLFHVDHCHETLDIRGLLCGSCNTALGLLGDTPEGVRGLLDYIERTHLELPSRVGLGG